MRQVARSAITGQFVTKEQAAANPDTTVLETMEDEALHQALLERVEQVGVLLFEMKALLEAQIGDD